MLRHFPPSVVLLIIVALLQPSGAVAADDWTLVGWNNLGMHCMDPDYSVFALLPPFNTLEAQLVDANGRLVRDASGVSVTYEAVADPSGSINSSSATKTNFWDFVAPLFGTSLPVDVGLAGSSMPGSANDPQAMSFDPAGAGFIAAGIPITPYDDAGHKNTYPLMRLVARDGSGTVRATTDVVLPVSDELNCHACHASDSSPPAEPLDGWVHDPDPERDVRLNILRLHDDLEAGGDTFTAALATAGYDPAGLYATATAGTPILCARCHASEALPGTGIAGIEPLTQAVHRRMANVQDPISGLRLDDVGNRSACYRCHPGAVTRCLRGVMGAAVAPDGTLAMQCQSCHGSMMAVAADTRTGWLDEPACQSCHTGTATHNNGQLRYTSVFENDGSVRRAVDRTFATTPDVPAAGFSLYRFSTGHGGLRCEACHGSTHAEFPSIHPNDNLQSAHVQGHEGVLVECNACHATTPNTVDGGPHGMHPVGAVWVDRHPDAAEEGGAQRCRACHGADDRGTALSRAQGDRVLQTDFGQKHFWPGFQIGCYTCHLGPSGEQANSNRAPTAADDHASTAAGTTVEIPLTASDPDGNALTLRIVSQAQHGTVGLDGATARYIPEPGFSGSDAFTFTASDGSTDGNLATVSIAVSAAVGCAGDCNGDHMVGIDELVRGVGISLGSMPLAQCATMDSNASGSVTIEELVQAINAALNGCPAAA